MSAAIDHATIAPRWYERACWKTIGKCVGSLTDQSLVSGTRFLTTILIGSFCDAAELGTYALGFSILMALQAIQMSLICRPYTIYGGQVFGRERNELAGSTLVHFLGFSALVCASLLAITGLNYFLKAESSLLPVFAVLAVGAPFILLREHARQFCFAHLNVAVATAVDFTATMIQVIGLCWLAWTSRLTAVTALVVMTIACGLSGLLWIWIYRDVIHVKVSRISSDFQRYWLIGKWDCASELTFTVQTHGMTWILALLLDHSSVGIYAACLTVIQLLNPLLLGLSSVLVPKTVEAYVTRGINGMHSIVRMTTLAMFSVTSVFAGLATIWGIDVLEFFYRGHGFVIPGTVVAALAVGLIVEVVGMGPENGLWAMERHSVNFRVNVIGAVATFGSAVIFIPTIGLTGAAVSFCIGRLVTVIAQWLAYRNASQELRDSVLADQQKVICSN